MLQLFQREPHASPEIWVAFVEKTGLAASLGDLESAEKGGKQGWGMLRARWKQVRDRGHVRTGAEHKVTRAPAVTACQRARYGTGTSFVYSRASSKF